MTVDITVTQDDIDRLRKEWRGDAIMLDVLDFAEQALTARSEQSTPDAVPEVMSLAEVNHCQMAVDSALEGGAENHDNAHLSVRATKRLCLTVDDQAAEIERLKAERDELTMNDNSGLYRRQQLFELIYWEMKFTGGHHAIKEQDWAIFLLERFAGENNLEVPVPDDGQAPVRAVKHFDNLKERITTLEQDLSEALEALEKERARADGWKDVAECGRVALDKAKDTAQGEGE